MLRRMVATGLLTAVAGAAQALPLFWIQQDCTTCSPVARDGVGSLAPFAPPAQRTSHGTA